MIVSMIYRILMIYMNFLNLFMLILKVLTYVYTRYLMTILYSLLIYPSGEEEVAGVPTGSARPTEQENLPSQ